ncbi:LAME_0D07052g1_1 [Lachancea meyersii CBS 8951]|uniref:LAME_0D07052g1_1 n=1 Tax=Lachancea meyersii CBS 8951 TaxID=1266667 RepID=A0A1G4JA63_9SACH|nr:LAME_0D07052g1_1 [Lachancea meyersii CBS 8951]
MEQLAEYATSCLSRAKHMWEDRGLPRIDALSFLLGSVVTILISFLEPVFKALIGGILVSLLTLLKYAVCVAGVVICFVILTSTKLDKLVPKTTSPETSSPKDVRKDFIQRAGTTSDDYEIVRYKDVKGYREKPPKKPVPPESTYEKFVDQARESSSSS